MSSPRVRFAPSPTGYLHIGGARTALFNWLFARRHGGVFVLRIEDTDVERSSDAMVEGILEGLRWLGLDWDEGPIVDGPYAPYYQSQRLEAYRAAAERLVAAGRAYYCYCSPDDLKNRRKAAEAAGEGWQYDRTCSGLAAATIDARERSRTPRAIRFKVPTGDIVVDDQVRGRIAFDSAHIEDFVILRSDGHPTYHLSVVCDDVAMRITHVVRGDDHISNTPKHVLLYQSFGADLPRFAHVPLILGPDKKRLSKRHGATSVMEYAGQGFLPDAMVNFLALLGWSAGSADRELFTRSDLISAFTLEGISGGNAVFNPEKLDWFNQQHIALLAPEALVQRLLPLFESAGLWQDAFTGDRHAWFLAVLELLKPRVKRLGDFLVHGRFFFTDAIVYDGDAVRKYLQIDGMSQHLEAVNEAFSGLEHFDAVETEAALRAVAGARGVKAASLIHAVRVSITGKSVSPGLFEVLALVGRQRVSSRLGAGLKLAAGAPA